MIIKKKVVIIGGGPAGLSLYWGLQQGDSDNILLIDQGKSVLDRDRYDKLDSASGQGGAGLFSDGKFSFFPSGSGLWKLLDDDVLKKIYH